MWWHCIACGECVVDGRYFETLVSIKSLCIFGFIIIQFSPLLQSSPINFLSIFTYLRTMKYFIVLAYFIVGAVLAAPADPKDATVLRYENDNIGIDGYKFA